MQAKHMQFYKAGHWVVFIKLGQKHASKDGIELAVFKAFGEVLSFGHSVVYSAHKQAPNQNTEIEVYR